MSIAEKLKQKLERQIMADIAKFIDDPLPLKLNNYEWRQYDELLLTRQKPLPKIFEPTGEKIRMRRPAPYESK